MGAASSARMLAAGATWRWTGLPAAGGALVTGACGADESARTIAAMQLVRAGDRSVPVVTEAALTRPEPEILVDVLASINTESSRTALAQVAEAPAAAEPTRRAAAAALRTLDEQ
jgi:hypothetical protein